MRQITSRIAGVLLVILLVTLIAFLLSYLSPTDAAVKSFSSMGIAPTEQQLAEKRAELGLDKPFLEQYAKWMAGIFQGDLGESFRNGNPVAEILFGALPYTLALSFASMALTLVISVPLGLACAFWRGSVFDRAMQAVTYFFNAMPSFFVALLLLYVFSVRLKMFGVLSTRDFSGILLPTIALSLPLSAWFSRQVRGAAIEQLSSAYVDGLRARGVSDFRIVSVHVLRNITVPLLTLIGVSLGMLLGGSAIVESIFYWPGLGFESIEAVGHRDYPFIGAYALTMAVIYLLANGAIDLSYKYIDPRIRQKAAGTSKRTRAAGARIPHAKGSTVDAAR